MRPRGVAAVAALVAVAAVWGLTFVMIKQAITDLPALEFLALRFFFAAALLAVAFPKLSIPSHGSLRPGILAGLALAAGYGFQTFGLKFIGATESGFITGMMVVFTPVIGGLVARTWPRPIAIAAVIMSSIGLILLFTQGRPLVGGIGLGEVLTLGCAMSFAIHVVVLAKNSPNHDARTLAIIQMSTCAVVFTALALLGQEWKLPTSQVVVALVVTSVGASALGFLVMTWATQVLTETQTAVTLTLEPVFAGIAGVILLEEHLSPVGWLGAILIFAAMLAANARSQ
ncbi:MAG: DMT family transporter [Actinomycetota bacterium]